MTDPFDLIHEGCFLGFRLGLRISAIPTGNLRVEESVYMFASGERYHPLEAALVSVTAAGDWLTDVASTLGVEPAWVGGFLDGFAQQPETSADAEYVQGYLASEMLRTMRYRRELPDRG